jgi:hypothetical protein
MYRTKLTNPALRYIHPIAELPGQICPTPMEYILKRMMEGNEDVKRDHPYRALESLSRGGVL